MNMKFRFAALAVALLLMPLHASAEVTTFELNLSGDLVVPGAIERDAIPRFGELRN